MIILAAKRKELSLALARALRARARANFLAADVFPPGAPRRACAPVPRLSPAESSAPKIIPTVG